MTREGFHIGPLFVHFYGVIIMLGALAAAWLTAWRAKKAGVDSEKVWDILPWALLGGVVGARVWHILTPPASMVERGYTTWYYLTHPLDMLMIWNGGLGIPGAVIGGAIALYIYCRRNKLSFLQWTDLIAPGLALAQAVGRWGNFVNQEVYGGPSNLPWAIFIEPRYRLPAFANVEYYHPLFFYEMLWNLFNMGVLLWVGARFAQRLRKGEIFMLYLIIYPVGRFFLEYLRLDPSPVAGLNANQTLMAITALSSLAFILLRRRLIPVEPEEVQDEAGDDEPLEPAAEADA